MLSRQSKSKEVLYKENLHQISGIKFTIREIDVIACILHNRGEKKIGNILGISYRTVGVHVRNIMAKLGQSSREYLIDFIETSGKMDILKQYYAELLIEDSFRKQLQKIKAVNRDSVEVIFPHPLSLNAEKSALLNSIIKHLSLVNINCVENAQENIEKAVILVLHDDITMAKNYKNCKIINIMIDDSVSSQPQNIDFTKEGDFNLCILHLISAILDNKRAKEIIDECKFEQRTLADVHRHNIAFENQAIVHTKAPNKTLSLYFHNRRDKVFISLFCLIVLYFGYRLIVSRFPYVTNIENKQNSQINIASDFKKYRLSHFTGRVFELTKLNEILQSQQISVIAGIPGAGKSSLALEYGYAQDKVGARIIWIDSESKDKIMGAFRNLAIELGIDISSIDSESIIRFVSNKVRNYRLKVIFIFDNLESSVDIRQFLLNLPQNVKVIITSRNAALLEHINMDSVIILEPFTQKEAAEFLTNNISELQYQNASKNQIEVNKLVSQIGLLPYHLSQAVGYLKENKHITINEFLEEQSYEKNIVYNLVRKPSKLWDLLQYITYLDPDFITYGFLSQILGVTSSEINCLVRKLEKMSIVQIVKRKEQLGIKFHRLVQKDLFKYIQGKMHTVTSLSNSEILEQLSKNLDYQMPLIKIHDTDIINRYNQIYLLYPHALKVLKRMEQKNTVHTASINRKLGYYYKLSGDWDESIKYNNLFLDQVRNQNQNSQEVSDTLNNIAGCYFELGDAQKSLEYYKRSENLARKMSNSPNKHLVWAVNNVGVAELANGNIQGAFIHLKDAVNLAKMVQKGKDSDFVQVITRGNLALIYHYLGDLNNTLKHSIEAHNILESMRLNQNNRSEGYIMKQLGLAYFDSGNLRQSLEYFKKSNTIYSKLKSEKGHALHAITLSNIGVLYVKLGDPTKGLQYHTQAYKMYNRVFSNQNHMQMALLYNNIADSYIGMEKYKEALEYSRRSYALYNSLLDNKIHPEKAHNLASLGNAYIGNGEIVQGISYLEKAIDMRLKWYSNKNHPYIAQSFYDLGVAYGKTGDLGKKLHYIKNAYVAYLNSLGKDHYDTHKTYRELKKQSYTIRDTKISKILTESRGGYNTNTSIIKNIVQMSLLNKIQKLAKNGEWSNSVMGYELGIKGYVEEKYLSKILGKKVSQDALSILKELCFEAISIGVMLQETEHPNIQPLKEFIKMYPRLPKKIFNSHPEYFIDDRIVKELNHDIQKDQ